MAKGDFEKNNPWWRPAMLFYSRATGWIILPLIVALLAGRKVEGFLFFGILMFAFGVTCYGIYREIEVYKKKIDNGKQ